MGMFVVSNIETGFSDESMRFASRKEAQEWINDYADPDFGIVHEMRYESDSPHPQNHVALGQIWRDGAWLDFARDTPEVAIRWAEKEPVALARVVDWISREVIWP